MEARQPFADVDVLWCADAPHRHAIEQASVDYHVPLVELWTAWSAILVGHLFQCRAHTPRAALAILYRPCALATYTAIAQPSPAARKRSARRPQTHLFLRVDVLGSAACVGVH